MVFMKEAGWLSVGEGVWRKSLSVTSCLNWWGGEEGFRGGGRGEIEVVSVCSS